MGGQASKTVERVREREPQHYAHLPYGGIASRPTTTASGGAAAQPSSATVTFTGGVSASARARATFNAHTKQSRAASGKSHKVTERAAARGAPHGTPAAARPWTPGPAPPSPHSTTFTVSTADSVRLNGRALRRLSSSSSGSREENDMVDPLPPSSTSQAKKKMSEHAGPRLTENERRTIEAEKILGEIAKEYAAKRAAGLVPTKPVPARMLLWEEMAKNRTQAGRRGQCIFGRDTDNVCGCTTYKKIRVPGRENPGGVCECCNHGAVWHRLVGGTMARSSRMSRSIIGSSIHASRLESGSYVPSEARSSLYDYDSDEDDEDDDEDEEAIANEMAVPSNFQPVAPASPALQTQGSSQGGIDRLSLLSIGSSYGFPSRLSSATNSLGALLQAIQRYRDMGLDEDEIELRIRQDFPPVPRKSSLAARSDVSQSQVDV